MTRDALIHLRHVLECIGRIKDYTKDGRASFMTDTRTQDAVIRNLEVIGQAIKDVGVEALASDAGEVPWVEIAGTRNVLAHQYLGVDLDLVWNITERDLPSLEAAVLRMIGSLDDHDRDGDA